MFKIIIAIFAIFLLTGCNNEPEIDETLPNQTHFIIDDFNQHGDDWQNFITIKVNTDNIVTYISLDGINRTASMTRRLFAQSEVNEELQIDNFYEEVSNLEVSLIGARADEVTEAIRQASESGEFSFDLTPFYDLAQRALHSQSIIEQGDYIDGLYHYASSTLVDGFNYFVNLFVIHGNIVTIYFNGISEEGLLKYDPILLPAGDLDIETWLGQMDLLAEEILRAQDVSTISFDADGVPTHIPGVDMPVQHLVGLVLSALALGPVSNGN